MGGFCVSIGNNSIEGGQKLSSGLRACRWVWAATEAIATTEKRDRYWRQANHSVPIAAG